MSQQKGMSNWVPYLIIFGMAFGIGAAVFTTVYATAGLQTAAGSIGEISEARDFQVGTWFRYDPNNYYGPDSAKIYMIANITDWAWSDDVADGDLAIDAVLGKRVLVPVWDIKVFWYTSGMEASELYAYQNGNSGIPLWDYLARFYSVANTPSWRLAEWTKTEALSGANSSYGSTKFYIPNWGTSYSSYDNKVTWVWEHYNTNVYMVRDRGTDMVIRTSAVVGTTLLEFKLASWSINTEMPVQTDDTWEIDTNLVRINNGAMFTLELRSNRLNYWNIEIASNESYYLNSTTISKYAGTQYKFVVEGYPLEVKINVRALSLLNTSIATDWLNKTFIIGITEFKIGSLTPLADVTIDSVENITTSTLEINWTAVSNADEYSVYVNGTYIGTTQDTTFLYQVPTLDNASYGFKVIADSYQTGYGSINFTLATEYVYDFVNPLPGESIVFGMNYGGDGENFSGVAYQEIPAPDATAWLWVVLVGALVVSVVLVYGYMRCKQNPNDAVACRISGVLPSKKAANKR